MCILENKCILTVAAAPVLCHQQSPSNFYFQSFYSM